MNRCMAHRGWSSRAPENTMAAFQLAFQEPRIHSIEMDVQVSKDGVPIIIHDFTLDRTTNGTGFVYQTPYLELTQLKVENTERIPTLEEVLQAARGKCRLNLELKTAGGLYQGIEKKVVELVQKYQMEQEVCLTSFDHQVIREVRDHSTNIQTGLILSGMPTLLEDQLKYTGATILSMEYPFITKPFAEEMIGKGYQIVAWTVNKQEEIERVMKIHPQIEICTNYPDRMFPFM
ncbi:glycerophosphodiester phosphodiesterase family protein [Ammoniphilus sp. YIM 78166]|uniref:glycerophosphodiester phosphodiesterase n=1 Tax=Ammoniphilus sp. YIM 78166 TaxID=1644106 RepID=UPI0010701E7D|nr:glycerophosphodiester phosphodiesterase family protein [Ammoniphilus sp. YIM 78166]